MQGAGMIDTHLPQRSTPPDRMDQHHAVLAAQGVLNALPDYVKVGAEPGRCILHARFHFPVVARQRYAVLLGEITAHTGWGIHIADDIHQGALGQMAVDVLPQGLQPEKTPSIHRNRCVVSLTYNGVASQHAIEEAQQRFFEETGWNLQLHVKQV